MIKVIECSLLFSLPPKLWLGQKAFSRADQTHGLHLIAKFNKELGDAEIIYVSRDHGRYNEPIADEYEEESEYRCPIKRRRETRETKEISLVPHKLVVLSTKWTCITRYQDLRSQDCSPQRP